MTTNAKNLVSELLPCPLCGTNKIKFVGVNRPYWFLRCDKCGCTGGLCMTKDQAHETWNTRAPMLVQEGDAVSESVCVEAVATIKRNDEGNYIDWLVEGCGSDLSEGVLLCIAPDLEKLLEEDGHTMVYKTPPHDDGKVARDAEPTADDLAELAQIVVDFDDCEETQASDKTLHRLVELGFLECIRYGITAKGSAAIKEQRSPSKATGSHGDDGEKR